MSDQTNAIDTRQLGGLIEICQRYYTQLSTGDQMLVERVAAQLEQHRQRQLLANMPRPEDPRPEVPQEPDGDGPPEEPPREAGA